MSTSTSLIGVGALPVSPALTGHWTLPDFPERVTVNGRPFRRAGWRQPYDGVVEQYREETPSHSMHLKVYSDGRWAVDHIDEDNPDLGRPVEHFFNDHPVGLFLKGAAAVAGVALVGYAGVRAVSRLLK